MEDVRDVAERDRGKRGGGGKLSRSETVTVRLDPKLNYLCELAARAQRRTKSSFIEWAIENALGTVGIPGEKKNATGDLWTIADRNTELWDVDDPERLVMLSYYAPSLLLHEEQVLWKLVATSPFLWKGHWEDDVDEEIWVWNAEHPANLIMDRLHSNWDLLKRVAGGEESREGHLPLKPRLVRGAVVDRKILSGKTPPHVFEADLDDDRPF